MSDQAEELAVRLAAEGDAVLKFFQGLSVDQLDQVVYTEGQSWRVRDLLAHFIAAERGFQQLFQDILSGGDGVPLDFPVDEYNLITVSELKTLEWSVLKAQYAMVRERTVALVSEFTPQQLVLTAQHPAVGKTLLREMVRVIYNHNNLHLRDARRALGISRFGTGRTEEARA